MMRLMIVDAYTANLQECQEKLAGSAFAATRYYQALDLQAEYRNFAMCFLATMHDISAFPLFGKVPPQQSVLIGPFHVIPR